MTGKLVFKLNFHYEDGGKETGTLKLLLHFVAFFLVASLLSTGPERIYNSHYGNGVPAMFTF